MFRRGRAAKSKPSRVLAAGNRAALSRSSVACRSSRALGLLAASSKILLADDCNYFFQP